MTTAFIPYGRQCIEDDDVQAVTAALKSDFLTTGPMIEAFETALAQRVNARHAVVCSSGTAALHIAMLALDLKPGEAAIVPSMTFAATANAVRYVGGEVIFADADPESGLMRPDDFKVALGRGAGKTVRAVLPVHLAGQVCDMPGIAGIARERGIAVIEDASHAIGSRYDGHAVGACAHGDMTIFSFHPVKTVAMAEGGAVTMKDGIMHHRVARLRAHGIEREPALFAARGMGFEGNEPNPWYYELQELGFNYRATDLQCALGISQLAKLDRFVSRRAELVERYDRLLAPLAPVLQPLARRPDQSVGWHLYVALINFAAAGISRAALMRELRKQGIGTQVHYVPLHQQPYYKSRYGAQSLPGAEAFYARALSLPLYPQLEDAEQDRVVDALRGLLRA
jgi:UDP-4-amino-4,6-dideoxy-N-acetyl-beta-L-altrosamine transaminase